jgi:hypothetical protein
MMVLVWQEMFLRARVKRKCYTKGDNMKGEKCLRLG